MANDSPQMWRNMSVAPGDGHTQPSREFRLRIIRMSKQMGLDNPTTSSGAQLRNLHRSTLEEIVCGDSKTNAVRDVEHESKLFCDRVWVSMERKIVSFKQQNLEIDECVRARDEANLNAEAALQHYVFFKKSAEQKEEAIEGRTKTLKLEKRLLVEEKKAYITARFLQWFPDLLRTAGVPEARDVVGCQRKSDVDALSHRGILMRLKLLKRLKWDESKFIRHIFDGEMPFNKGNESTTTLAQHLKAYLALIPVPQYQAQLQTIATSEVTTEEAVVVDDDAVERALKRRLEQATTDYEEHQRKKRRRLA